jgi:hypothetical protein
MIALTGNVQINGLGRAFARTLDHNRIYLTVPTTRTNHFYDVRTGLLGELWGAYGSSFPVVLATRENDHHIRLSNTHTLGKESRTVVGSGWYTNRSEWSEDLALSCYPTTVSKIAEMVLDPKTEPADLQKVMVEFVKVKVSRHKSDGAWFFTVDEADWDLEHVCNEITRVTLQRSGFTYTYPADDVVDYFSAHVGELFHQE